MMLAVQQLNYIFNQLSHCSALKDGLFDGLISVKFQGKARYGFYIKAETL